MSKERKTESTKGDAYGKGEEGQDMKRRLQMLKPDSLHNSLASSKEYTTSQITEKVRVQ